MNDVEIFLNKKIVHRGAFTNDVPENSIGSFQKAIDEDFIIEIDILLTKDNEVIVFHDDNLNRLTGLDKDVKDLTYEEISKLMIRNTNERIPNLEETLNFIDGRVPLLIDIKSTDFNTSIAENIYRIIKDYSGEYAIQSFNPFILKWFRKNLPNTVRIQLSSDFLDEDGEKLQWYKKFMLKYLLLNFISKPHMVAYKINSKYSLSLKIIKNTMPLIFWTITNQEVMFCILGIMDLLN